MAQTFCTSKSNAQHTVMCIFFMALMYLFDVINKYARTFCLPMKKPRCVATAGF